MEGAGVISPSVKISYASRCVMARRASPASSSGGFLSTGKLMDTWIFFLFVAIAGKCSIRTSFSLLRHVACVRESLFSISCPASLAAVPREIIPWAPSKLFRLPLSLFRFVTFFLGVSLLSLTLSLCQYVGEIARKLFVVADIAQECPRVMSFMRSTGER